MKKFFSRNSNCDLNLDPTKLKRKSIQTRHTQHKCDVISKLVDKRSR